MNIRALCIVVMLIGAMGSAMAGSMTKSPDGAEVYIIEPKDGATVSPTFTVKFGLKGMGVAPAGVKKKNTGHHHLLVNVNRLPIRGVALPKSTQVLHFDKGETEAEITLEKGKHTLQVILGDHNHIPHDKPVVSQSISVNVK